MNGKEKTKFYSPTLDKLSKTSKKTTRIVSWEAVPPQLLYELVVAVNDARGAVLLGATQDRGAWAITIFHEQLPKGKITEYCNSEEMVEDFVRGLAEIWGDVARELSVASVT